MEEDGVLTLDGIAEVRRSTQDALRRTVLRQSLIGILGGCAFGVFGYFANWARTGDPTLTVVFALLFLAIPIPTIVHWVRHFRSLLSQLASMKQECATENPFLHLQFAFIAINTFRHLRNRGHEV